MDKFLDKIHACRVYAVGFVKIVFMKLIHRKNIEVNYFSQPSLFLNTKISRDSYIELGRRFVTRGRSYIQVGQGGKIKIGNNVFLNEGCRITAFEKILIEDDCIFGPNVTIYDHDHKFSKEGIIPGYKTSEVVVEKGTWVGANTIILRGTHIGKNCVIGAGSIVKGNIPDNSIVKVNREIKIEKIY